jgi:hypothetical protein
MISGLCGKLAPPVLSLIDNKQFHALAYGSIGRRDVGPMRR